MTVQADLDLQTKSSVDLDSLLAALPEADNRSDALRSLQEANEILRTVEWPEPFHELRHRVHLGDARDLSWIPDESVHLVVTSPPYWTLKEYNDSSAQLGAIEDYESFLDELDQVWGHCNRVLAPGGRICCVVGDVCIPRRAGGRHHVMPLHADIQVRMRRIGLDNLTPIHWYKIANAATEATGNGAGFYGKPYQPGAVVKNDVEYILFFRKGGTYRSPTRVQKALSMLSRDEMQTWFRTVWADVRGASTRHHPAPFPVEVALRLIRMFSFAGDIVLDPFLGTGTTIVAAIQAGRNSVGVEIDPEYYKLAKDRIQTEALRPRTTGPKSIRTEFD